MGIIETIKKYNISPGSKMIGIDGDIIKHSKVLTPSSYISYDKENEIYNIIREDYETKKNIIIQYNKKTFEILRKFNI